MHVVLLILLPYYFESLDLEWLPHHLWRRLYKYQVYRISTQSWKVPCALACTSSVTSSRKDQSSSIASFSSLFVTAFQPIERDVPAYYTHDVLPVSFTNGFNSLLQDFLADDQP